MFFLKKDLPDTIYSKCVIVIIHLNVEKETTCKLQCQWCCLNFVLICDSVKLYCAILFGYV